MVVSRMIVAFHDEFLFPPWSITKADSKDYLCLIRRFCRTCEYLLGESDLERGRRFLSQYIWRNTTTPWLDLRGGDCLRLDRESVVEQVEATLMVRFPSLGSPSTEESDIQARLSAFPLAPLKDKRNLHRGPAAAGKQLSPTLASSLSSLDLAMFKKTAVKAARSRVFPWKPSSAPSSVLRGISGRFPGLRGLTRSLKSMSISGDESLG